MREAGCTAPQEVAFTFANGLEYIDRAVASGLDANVIAARMSFFFAAHNDLFEEAAKFRAARRLWALLLRDRYGADDRACQLRFHTQTGGSTLTAQQPLNNVVRVTVQALAATLGGTQSLHTNAYDEALALPTADSARLALRTQQVLAHESGVAQTADPLGGSHYVEALTDGIEREAKVLLGEIEQLGGAARAVERGYFEKAIARAAYEHQQLVESNARTVVGVNAFTVDGPPPVIPAPDYTQLEVQQQARVRGIRAKRDPSEHATALAELRSAAAAADARLMEPVIAAVRARATVQEISDVFRGVWGTFVRPA
jgi:methylmalonyl-CoA mutase N-terminal domain/subunit